MPVQIIKKLAVIMITVFSLYSCNRDTYIYRGNYHPFFKSDLFTRVEVRSNYFSNSDCAIVLMPEGLTGRSTSYFSNSYNVFFIPMDQLNMDIVAEIQHLSNKLLEANFDTCYCDPGTDLVWTRYFLISDYNNGKHINIADRNYSGRKIFKETIILDSIYEKMLLMIPEKYFSNCWKGE